MFKPNYTLDTNWQLLEEEKEKVQTTLAELIDSLNVEDEEEELYLHEELPFENDFHEPTGKGDYTSQFYFALRFPNWFKMDNDTLKDVIHNYFGESKKNSAQIEDYTYKVMTNQLDNNNIECAKARGYLCVYDKDKQLVYYMQGGQARRRSLSNEQWDLEKSRKTKKSLNDFM